MNKYNIKFTRHSKQRMKLYKITEEVVVNIIETGQPAKSDDGKFIYGDL